VTTVGAIDSQITASAANTSSLGVLNSDDFLKIMITELTNQDPFEPMKNQDLLNQMSTIQQLESNRSMSTSFTQLMDRFDGLLLRQNLNAAGEMIGQLISGTTASGSVAVGKVVAVGVEDNDILLELDTGERVNLNDTIRVGGSNSRDIVGEIVVGLNEDGQKVVGKVESVEVNGTDVTLHLQLRDNPDGQTIAIPLSDASIINANTVELLIGHYVEGLAGDQTIAGVVESVQWAADQILLNLEGEEAQLDLEDLTSIYG